MATLDTFAVSHPSRSGNLFSTLLGRVIAWNDRRMTLRMLNGLTDHELEDIGLERGNLHAWVNR